MTSTTNSKCCKPTRMPEAYSKLPRSNSILYRVYTMKGYSRKVTTSTEHSLNLVRKDIYCHWPRRMTEISINEMIVKVNSLLFTINSLKLRSMLLTFQDVLSSPKWSYSFIGEKKCHVKCNKAGNCFLRTTGHCFWLLGVMLFPFNPCNPRSD